MLTFALGDHRGEPPRQHQRHRLLRHSPVTTPPRTARRSGCRRACTSRRRRRTLDAAKDVPRVHRVRRGDRGDRRSPWRRRVRTSSTARSSRPMPCRPCSTSRPTWTSRRRRPGARVPVPGQGTVARADHGRGRLRPDRAEEGAEAVRPGRREASQAARPPRLVSDGLGRSTPGPRWRGSVQSAPAVPHPRSATGSAGRMLRRPVRTTVDRADIPALVLPARRDRCSSVIFVVPTVAAFYFSLTRWTLFDAEFIGLDNFAQFVARTGADSGLRNTIVYAVVTSGLKVILGLLLATLLTSGLRPRDHHPALDHLLPGPRQHGRGRDHLRGPDASVRWPDQHSRSRSSGSTGRPG